MTPDADKRTDAADKRTPCACPAPGFCPRHGCQKHAHWLSLCQTRPDYFALWEQGRGPGQAFSMARPTAAEFPCPHRGAVVAIEPCQLCGGRDLRAEVCACDLHQYCTVGAYGIRRDGIPVPVCISCPDLPRDQRQPVDSSAHPS